MPLNKNQTEQHGSPQDEDAPEVPIDNFVNQGFDGCPYSLPHPSWLSTRGCAIRKKVHFDFLPTNPQTDILPTWQCEIIVRLVDLMKNTQEPNTTEEISLPIPLPEAITCEAACIYNIDGKCAGMLSKQRLTTLLDAYNAAKAAGIHNLIQPPVQDPATEMMGLLQRQKAPQTLDKKAIISNTLITPSHIRQALQKWGMVTTERFSSPLEFDPAHNSYYSREPWDKVFGSQHDAFAVQLCGHSFCHPPHDDEIMFQLLRHAVHSSTQDNMPMATFMLLPHWRGYSRNAYMSWLNSYPHCAKVLAKFPVGKI